MKKWMIMSLAFLMLVFPFANIYAEDKAVEEPTFTIEPLFPENQIDNKAGYFHLDIRDQLKQKIEVVVYNNSKTEQKFDIYFNIAKTNRNGLIVYENEEASGANHTLPFNIERHVSLSEDHIIVPARSEKKITMILNYENLKYPGVLMGALTVREHLDPKDEGITHQYQYTVGLVLSQDGRKDLPSSQSFEMNDVSLGLDGGHKVLDYYVDNLESNIARNLDFETNLSNLNTEQVIFNEKVENYSIAPNGRLPLRLDWLKKDVKPGRYRLKLELNEGQETWTYDFEISEEKAQTLNAEASYKVILPSWIFGFCVILGLLTLVNTIYLIQRENRREDRRHIY